MKHIQNKSTNEYLHLDLKKVKAKYLKGKPLTKSEVILLKHNGIIPYEDEKDRINRGYPETSDKQFYERSIKENKYDNIGGTLEVSFTQIIDAVKDNFITKDF